MFSGFVEQNRHGSVATVPTLADRTYKSQDSLVEKCVEAVNIVKDFRYHGGLYEENEPSTELAVIIN